MNKIFIDSKKNNLSFNFKELREYKDLLFFLVLRDVKVIYKQTILGFGWAIIQPFIAMVIFTLFFGKFAGIEEKLKDGVPYAVFSYVALVPWFYFSSALSASANSLIGSSGLISKVYFPRFIIPLTPILAKMIDFFIAFIILIVLFFIYGLIPHTNRIIYVPFFFAWLAFTALGAGLWLSAMAIQYRDVQFILPFIIQTLMFISPVVWPVSFVPEKYQLLYSINPLVGIIDGFREALIGNDQIRWDFIKVGCITSSALFVSGFWYFKKKENYFADIV